MSPRERYIKTLLGQKVDRVPFLLSWGPWPQTWQRWKREGMPAEFKDYGDVRRFFEADQTHLGVGVNVGPCPRRERTVLEETDEYVIFIDSWGIRRRDYKGGMSMSEFMSFPVKSRSDWERFRDEFLNPDDPRRIECDLDALAREAQATGAPVRLGGFPDTSTFGIVRWLLGDEEGLLAFYLQPELVHEIIDHMCDIYINVWEKAARRVRVDEIHIWEDFCGKQGPLISPQHWQEFCSPTYGRIKSFADRHGIPLISVDTDGWADPAIPVMMQAGMNVLEPWEVAAGNDINQARRKFPDLGMMGGIDKRELAKGPEAIDRELERIAPAIATGRYIPELDHLIPDDVSWPNYSHFARKLREVIGA
jgi:uroporphyrinogen decarboxylase